MSDETLQPAASFSGESRGGQRPLAQEPLKTLRVEGATVRYFELGAGEPLLLLHGYPQNHRCWRHHAAALAATHRVIAPDWFGWGESERRFDIEPEYDAEVARIGLLADALGLGRFNLAGHDYGGYLGLGFAQRAPDRVLRLAILNSRAHRSFAPGFYRLMALSCLAARTPVLRTLLASLPLYWLHQLELRRYVPDAFTAGAVEDYVGWLRSRHGRRWWVHFYRHYEAPPRPALDAGLKRLPQPTAVIWGERDRYCPVGIGNDLAARIPNASLTCIPDAGHFVLEESPEPVLAALNDWLARPVSQSGSQ